MRSQEYVVEDKSKDKPQPAARAHSASPPAYLITPGPCAGRAPYISVGAPTVDPYHSGLLA